MSKENLENKVEGQESRRGIRNITNYMVGAVALTGAITGGHELGSMMENVDLVENIFPHAKYIANMVGGSITGYMGHRIGNYLSGVIESDSREISSGYL